MSYAGHANLITLQLADSSAQVDSRLTRMLATSLVVHAVLLLGFMNVRFAPTLQQPLASYHVNLVTLPEPRVAPPAPSPAAPMAPPEPPKTASPTPVEPIQVERVTPSIVDAVEGVAVPQSREMTPVMNAPAVTQLPVQAVRKADERQAISALVIPQAPQLSTRKALPDRVTPDPSAPSTSSLAETLRQAVQTVAVPQKPQAPKAQIPSPVTPKSKPISPKPQGAPVTSLNITTPGQAPQMAKVTPVPKPTEIQPNPRPQSPMPDFLEHFPQPAVVPPEPETVQPNALDQKIAKLVIPEVQVPETHHILSEPTDSGMQNTTTTLQVAGSSPEGNVYWGRVWSKIDREWIAPQVNIRSGRPLQVVLAFRIERDGGVKNLAIEQSSGNEYYDVAAKRAVLNATPLPPFASDMPEPFYDIQFQFTVNVDF